MQTYRPIFAISISLLIISSVAFAVPKNGRHSFRCQDTAGENPAIRHGDAIQQIVMDHINTLIQQPEYQAGHKIGYSILFDEDVRYIQNAGRSRPPFGLTPDDPFLNGYTFSHELISPDQPNLTMVRDELHNDAIIRSDFHYRNPAVSNGTLRGDGHELDDEPNGNYSGSFGVVIYVKNDQDQWVERKVDARRLVEDVVRSYRNRLATAPAPRHQFPYDSNEYPRADVENLDRVDKDGQHIIKKDKEYIEVKLLAPAYYPPHGIYAGNQASAKSAGVTTAIVLIDQNGDEQLIVKVNNPSKSDVVKAFDNATDKLNDVPLQQPATINGGHKLEGGMDGAIGTYRPSGSGTSAMDIAECGRHSYDDQTACP